MPNTQEINHKGEIKLKIEQRNYANIAGAIFKHLVT